MKVIVQRRNASYGEFYGVESVDCNDPAYIHFVDGVGDLIILPSQNVNQIVVSDEDDDYEDDGYEDDGRL